MKKGQWKIIYQDPLSQTKEEGKAQLMKYLGCNYECEYWDVRFFGEKENYPRHILKDSPNNKIEIIL